MQRRDFLKKTGLVIGSGLLAGRFVSSSQVVKKPNIVYILADDLGYGELGVYGQKLIKTPNIDKLAGQGKLFTQHYAGSPVCAPSRCVLLTGKHSGHAYIRGNDEWNARGKVWDFAAAAKDIRLEGQRPLPAGTISLGKLLQKAGYKTACVGKWGLGPAYSEGSPNKQGFDFFFGYNCQRQAHTYYPEHLWKNEKKVLLNNKPVFPGTMLDKGSDPEDEASYADYNLNEYAPALMGKETINFIEDNKDNPFFLYFASPLPHLPLQAPKKYVDRYRKIFGKEKPYPGKYYFPCQYPRATYAAMISYLDEQVGSVVKKLKDIGQYDNTLIIFTSDNGPTYTGGVDTEFFNSGGIFGHKYGRGKGFTHEGGIRVPMIVAWKGRIEPGSKTTHISAFYDILPTFCDLAGVKAPPDTDGLSFLPLLLGKTRQKEHEFLYWEFPSYKGQQAVRMNKWKGIRKNIFEGNMKIELYDLQKDPAEQHNLADRFPEIVKKIEMIMKREHQPARLPKFKIKQLGD
jgi:arylsulfatase